MDRHGEEAIRQIALIATVLAGVFAYPTSPRADVQCDKLQSTQTPDRLAAATLNAAIDRWFTTPGSDGHGVEEIYRDVAANVLKGRSQADRLYVWERVIFLKCRLMDASAALNVSQKLHAFDNLTREFYSPPPALAMGQ